MDRFIGTTLSKFLCCQGAELDTSKKVLKWLAEDKLPERASNRAQKEAEEEGQDLAAVEATLPLLAFPSPVQQPVRKQRYDVAFNIFLHLERLVMF